MMYVGYLGEDGYMHLLSTSMTDAGAIAAAESWADDSLPVMVMDAETWADLVVQHGQALSDGGHILPAAGLPARPQLMRRACSRISSK